MRGTISQVIFRIVPIFLSVCALILTPNGSLAISVGPDAFGYISIDSGSVGGPAYNFEDISSTGTRLTFNSASAPSVPNANDGVAANISLITLNNGAGFPFYGSSFTEVHVSTNGFLTFDLNPSSGTGSNKCPVPDLAAPNNSIYVLWDDLILENPPLTGRGGYVQSFENCPLSAGGSSACVIFQWENADISGGAVSSFDFQVALYSNGNILMNYAPGNPDAGQFSTTGIENGAASIGLTHACNTFSSIPASSSVLFTPIPLGISLNKTVALDTGSNLCSTEDSVAIIPGQLVRYCYKATNTGFIPLDTHEVIDEQLGIVVAETPELLIPGASIFYTATTTISSSITSSATWTARTLGALSTFGTDSATVIVDSDGDGAPDEGDLCPSDPNKVTAGQCGCGTADSDSDGDAFLDCLDQCPADSNKSAPLVCGCGTQDLDLNVNGVIDCQLTPDLKAQLKRLLTQVGKLGAAKNSIKPSKVKKTLVGVVNQINLSGGALTVTANTDVAALSLSLDKAVRKALKVKNENFAKNKKKARSRVKALIKVLVV